MYLTYCDLQHCCKKGSEVYLVCSLRNIDVKITSITDVAGTINSYHINFIESQNFTYVSIEEAYLVERSVDMKALGEDNALKFEIYRVFQLKKLPGSYCFFGGRLMLSGTLNEPQKI